MAIKAKELQFTVKNKIGALAEITQVLKTAKVNMLHIAAWEEGAKGGFILVTADNAAAKKALKKLGVSAAEKDVLVVRLRNRPGALDRIAKKLAKNKIDVKVLFATTGGKTVAVMIDTKNNAKAAKII